MRKFILKFCDNPKLELIEMRFSHPLISTELLCIRGKMAGSFSGWGTFQWTKAVQALALISVKSAFEGLYSDKSGPLPRIEGRESSPALSLDYSIQKRTNWILDIFGCDSNGLSLARRLFLINNSGKKRPGPVVLSLNPAFLSFEDIEVFLNDKRVLSREAFTLLVETLSDFNNLSELSRVDKQKFAECEEGDGYDQTSYAA